MSDAVRMTREHLEVVRAGVSLSRSAACYVSYTPFGKMHDDHAARLAEVAAHLEQQIGLDA